MQFATLLTTTFATMASAQYLSTTYSGISSPLYANNGGYGRPPPPNYRPQPFGGRPSLGQSYEYGLGGQRCSSVNGQCEDNFCNGTPDSPYCKTGPYAGCPCGFGCGSSNGPCGDSGCAGIPSGRGQGTGVCTQNFVGCSCNLY